MFFLGYIKFIPREFPSYFLIFMFSLMYFVIIVVVNCVIIPCEVYTAYTRILNVISKCN